MTTEPRTFQNLGGGIYRVGGNRRSAITGRYLAEEDTTPHAEPSNSCDTASKGYPDDDRL